PGLRLGKLEERRAPGAGEERTALDPDRVDRRGGRVGPLRRHRRERAYQRAAVRMEPALPGNRQYRQCQRDDRVLAGSARQEDEGGPFAARLSPDVAARIRVGADRLAVLRRVRGDAVAIRGLR